MANNRTSRVLLEYRIAKQSADEAVNKTRKLANEIDMMREELEAIEKAGRDADKGLGKAFNSKTLNTASRITNEIEAQNNAIRDATRSVQRYNDEFDDVSRNVGLAGDVQSNLGAIGGIAGGLGGAGGAAAGQGIGLAGEFVALIEEAPRLKSALAGLPSTIGSAVSALGASGVGLIGGIGALTAVFVLATQAGQKAAAATRERLDAEREINDLLITGTTEEIQARRDQLEIQRQVAQVTRDETQAAIEAFDRDARNLAGATGELGVQFLRLGETLNIGALGSVRELRSDLGTLNNELNTVNRQIEAFDQALQEAEPTVQDLIEVERALTQERLASARETASQLQREFQLRGQSAEQLQQRNEAILNEIAVTQTEINALRASGDESTEVTDRIDALTQQLMNLGRESTFIRDTALDLARAREEETAVAEKQLAVQQAETEQRNQTINAVQQYNADIQRIDQQYFKDRADLEQRFADEQIKITEQAVKASSDALRELERERAQLATELQRDERDAQIEAQRDERDALRDHLRDLQDIRQRAQDEEFEAILNRDFASLFRSRRETTRNLGEAQQDFGEQAQDRQQAFADERQDRLMAYQQNLADAQQAYQQERAQIQQQRQQALRDAQQAQREELATARQSYQQQLIARKQAVTAELQLIQQGAQARLRIEQQTQQALLNQAQTLLGNIAMQSTSRGGGGNWLQRNNTLNANMTINGGDTQQVQRMVTNTITRIFGR